MKTHRSSAHRSSTILLVMLAISLPVSGCSYMPAWMGGRKDDTPKLPGTRIAVLPVNSELQPDESLKDAPVTLPAATMNTDWPQHTGMVTALAGNLGAGGLDKVTQASAGDGESFDHVLIPRPVVAGGMAFAMDSVGNISAHDAADVSHVRWESKGVAEEDEPHLIGGGLAFDQGRLYATSGGGRVAAFDAATGKELWHKSLRVPFRSAPRVDGGKLFATTIDNQVYALNALNGDILWNARGINETADLMNSVSPAVAGDVVIVPYSSGEIYALSVADGREIWNDSLSPGTRTQASSFFAGIGGDPIIDSGVVFAVSSGGMLSVLAANSGQRLWERPIGAINTPWVAGDYMFLLTTDNTLLCFIKYDGRIRWATKLASFEAEELKRRPISWKGPVMVDGRLAVVSSNGQLVLVNATDGKITATKEIPDDIYTSPVVAGGRMYLVSQDATLYSVQ